MKQLHVIACVLLLSLIIATPGMTGENEAPEKSVAAAALEIKVKEVQPITYVCIPHKGSYADHDGVFEKLTEQTNRQNISSAGPPFGCYYNSPMEVKEEDLLWEVGFPVTGEITVEKPLELKKRPAESVAFTIYTGPYEKIGSAYSTIFSWIFQNGYMLNGPCMEIFLSDPSKMKPEDLQAEIRIPVKKR